MSESLAPGQTAAFAQRADAVLRRTTELARTLVGAHQGAISLIVGGDWPTGRKYFSLSSKYLRWAQYRTAPMGRGVHSLVVSENRVFRLTQAELEAHPDWIGFGAEAAHHPPMRGWLAVPLLGEDGRNYGLLQLSDRVDGRDFDEADQERLESLAALASLALDALCSAYNEGAASVPQEP